MIAIMGGRGLRFPVSYRTIVGGHHERHTGTKVVD